MNKKQIIYAFLLLLYYAVVFLYQWVLTHTFFWTVIGVAVISEILVYLSSMRPILKVIGEYQHPKRTKYIIILTWCLASVISLPFIFYLLDQLHMSEPDYKNCAIFILVPILLGVAVGLTKVPNTTNKTQSGLVCVIKKLAVCTALFIIFIPFFTLTNKLQININSPPDFLHLESLFFGFVGWSMAFCFYAGLFLFLFALIDFILVIKDLSIKRPRKSRKTRKDAKLITLEKRISK